jgi:hypothetical protein
MRRSLEVRRSTLRKRAKRPQELDATVWKACGCVLRDVNFVRGMACGNSITFVLGRKGTG